jgi:hypothetical protein
VYTGRLSADTTPQSPIELPDRLDDVLLVEGGLTLSEGIATLRFHNREQLSRGIPDGRWAMLAFVPKKGGAA